MDNHIEATSVEKKDKGFTLVELLIVIVILGILATVTVFAVRGITDKGQTNACATDQKTLETAVESYFANYGGTAIPTATYPVNTGFTGNAANTVAVAAPTGLTQGATPGQTLVNAQLIRSLPTNYFVKSDGTLLIAKAACVPTGGTLGQVAT